jgi:glycogen debranching enzyme
MEQARSNENFQVLASSSLTEEKTIVLKHDNTFAIFNKYGDIVPFEKSSQGIFYRGTRFLSEFTLMIEGQKPLFLSSNLRERSEMLAVDLTNPDIIEDHHLMLEKGTIHIMRKKVLWDSLFYEQIHFKNFGLDEVEIGIELELDADFDDIFEVRGTERNKKGLKLPSKLNRNEIEIEYVGLDQTSRITRVSVDPEPEHIERNRFLYSIRLSPGQSYVISATMNFIIAGEPEREVLTFGKAIKKHKRRFDFIDETSCDIFTSNDQFNHWINRSRTDLITVISETPYGPYPFAGIPWYDTPFGRDGIITAFECLWASPEVAKGVLLYLAATQATETDGFRDAEPGKILHETRNGEMALLDEIPFKQYYGTIDATPLFVVLAGAYFKRTNDIETIEKIWNNIERALEWIDKYGDINGDMFVEYQRKEESGLFNQGWKDSHDSIMYENGRIADLPIALCEVQGYVYDAWIKAAMLCKALGNQDKCSELSEKAEKLKQNFTESFWSEDDGTFHLALAGDKKPCKVLSSNAGHCLFSGIATQQQAEVLAKNLLSESMFTGWGIRTLSSDEARYNPMSYHNGSVWPHDTALIAYGFSRYGLKEEVNKITKGLFDASLFFEGQRLPELFCGFKRRQGEAPTNYPVACSPQAWSVAATFMIIQASLGMEINEHENVIRFYRPSLPDFIDSMTIRNLSFKNMKLRIEFIRTGDSVSIMLRNKNVKVEVLY